MEATTFKQVLGPAKRHFMYCLILALDLPGFLEKVVNRLLARSTIDTDFQTIHQTSKKSPAILESLTVTLPQSQGDMPET